MVCLVVALSPLLVRRVGTSPLLVIRVGTSHSVLSGGS